MQFINRNISQATLSVLVFIKDPLHFMNVILEYCQSQAIYKFSIIITQHVINTTCIYFCFTTLHKCYFGSRTFRPYVLKSDPRPPVLELPNANACFAAFVETIPQFFYTRSALVILLRAASFPRSCSPLRLFRLGSTCPR